MSNEELITRQQHQIESLKDMFNENIATKKELEGMFVSIGQPLNDNVLQFNKEQLNWCFKVHELITQIH